ncbi:MAG: radical SAM protein, partial [Candidatus Aenigmatarchaeota archaeon]
MKIKIIKTQKVLSPTQISIGDYVINPYRGCEFGCLYCYSQENKNLQKSNFYNFLGIKINAHLVLERQLYYINPKRVVLGSTTECFQYKELEYKITERILEVLNKYKIPYTILTKSHLIKNYLHLIAQNPKNKIYFTFNCNSDEIIKILEKRSPNIKERLEAIEEILRKNINLRLHIGPFIPYISNLEEILKKIPKEIKEIDIELYHYKMGNFKEMLEVIK